ncbi:hypothetical protein Dda_2205 [Drechslerella dactyloides]|uniref:Uncharacterized protein n=1 Tax=Drechslerella dactyloides TaxID=74499 RepID=A0AAD6J767_DREDA|nr:hypothetical protein Dda_2205 [Drechslerella dactyloides]
MLTLHDLLQSPFTRNFFLLLPFLLLGGLILFLLSRADTLRSGAGLNPPSFIPAQVDNPAAATAGDEEADDEVRGHDAGPVEYDDEVDVDDLLAEAGGGGIVNDDDDGGVDGDGGAGGDGRPGPAAPAPRPPKQRGIVGKKKARNLEMRDQRRAYNEFLQSQARDRRARERTLEADLQDSLFAEKQRRALAEISIEKRKLKDREDLRALDALNAQHVQSLRSLVAEISSAGACGKISLRTLGHRVGKDEEWVKRTMKEEKIPLDPGGGGDVVSLVTESGWLVRVGREEIAAIAQRVEKAGKMSWEELGGELESCLKRL